MISSPFMKNICFTEKPPKNHVSDINHERRHKKFSPSNNIGNSSCPFTRATVSSSILGVINFIVPTEWETECDMAFGGISAVRWWWWEISDSDGLVYYSQCLWRLNLELKAMILDCCLRRVTTNSKSSKMAFVKLWNLSHSCCLKAWSLDLTIRLRLSSRFRLRIWLPLVNKWLELHQAIVHWSSN